MADRELSLAELGEHIEALSSIHKEAMDSDEETPSLDFDEIQRRGKAISDLIDDARGLGRAGDADPENTAGDPLHPTRGTSTGASDAKLGSSRLSRDEAFGGRSKAQTCRAVAALFGTPDPAPEVARLLNDSHIRSNELPSLKRKK